MNRAETTDHPSLLDRWLGLVLLLLAGQSLLVLATGLWGGLAQSWIASAVWLGLCVYWARLSWKTAGAKDRASILVPWMWWGPWVAVILFSLQIYWFPTTMHDSLSYRLPRIYLWLQQGRISEVKSADWRMNAMPWGWDSKAIPFLSINLREGCRLLNLAMWIIAYQLIHELAISSGADANRSRWIALALSLPPGFALQAPSSANDLYASVLLMIGVRFVLRHRHIPGPLPVLGSLMALVLASNAKPQFLVLGGAWLVWWLVGNGRPWRQISWFALVGLAPLYVLVSPIPLLLGNLLSRGSLTGDGGTNGPHVPILARMVGGCSEFIIAQLQLPVMPGVKGFNLWLAHLPGIAALCQLSTKYGPGLTELPLVDNASFGLVHAVVLSIGCLVGWKHSGRGVRWLLFVMVVSFLIAASQVNASTLGRSFMGFVILAYPMAVCGLAMLRSCHILVCAVIVGLVCTVMDPSHPLWPSDLVEEMANAHNMGSLAAKLKSYNDYRDRASTGNGMLLEVPRGEAVGVLLRGGTPLANLWRPDWRAHHIEFIHDTPVEEFSRSGVQWLLIGANASEQFPDAFRKYSELARSWDRVHTDYFRATLQQGPEEWVLYHRRVK